MSRECKLIFRQAEEKRLTQKNIQFYIYYGQIFTQDKNTYKKIIIRKLNALTHY